jgi:hypothetical protein
MTLPKATLRTTCLAAALLFAGASQAALTEYNTQASFLGAVLASGTDNFNSLAQGTPISGPLARTAGSFSYSVNATLTDATGVYNNPFYNVGPAGDTWLSSDSALATITFSGFGPGVTAIGGSFFPTNLAGAVTAGSVTLVATDSAGSVTRTLLNPTASTFWGVASDTSLVSLTLIAVNGAGSTTNNFFPAVNDLVLGSAVPEPQTWALLVAGMLAIGGAVRRRQR